MWFSSLRTRLTSIRTRVRSLASLSGLRIWRCCELRCRLQTRLGSGVAVALVWAGSYSSGSIPSLGSSICHEDKKIKNKNKLLGILACYLYNPLFLIHRNSRLCECGVLWSLQVKIQKRSEHVRSPYSHESCCPRICCRSCDSR